MSETHRPLPPIRSVVLAVLLGGFLVCPDLSFAQGASESTSSECVPDYDGPRRVPMTHEDREGVWIATPVLRCMVADLAELPLVRQRIDLLESRLEMRDGQLENLRRAVEMGRLAEDSLIEALEAAVSAGTAAEGRAEAWWRHPGVWFTVGVVVSAGLVALAAYSLSMTS